MVKTSSSDFKLIFRFGFGMNITALRGRLSADLIVQRGAPAGSDAPGVLVTPNPLGSWPMFKKAVGAASIVLRVPNEQERRRGSLAGAIVTGLGAYDGNLSVSNLTEAVRAGVLRYLLQVIDVLGKDER